MPKVSIVTACYNAEAYIGEAIESIRQQSFTDWEQIIVNDGSTDKSAETIAQFAAIEPRIEFVYQENSGYCKARNRGYKNTKPSEYILFFDADDRMVPNFLAAMVEYLDRDRDVGVVYCDHWIIDAEGHRFDRPCCPRFIPSSNNLGMATLPDEVPNTPIFSLVAGLGAGLDNRCLFRRHLYEQTSGWDENLQGGYILDLLIQMGLMSKIHFLPQRLYEYRVHNCETQMSRQGVYRAKAASLLEKWMNKSDLTPEQRAKIDEIITFYREQVLSFAEREEDRDLLKNLATPNRT